MLSDGWTTLDSYQTFLQPQTTVCRRLSERKKIGYRVKRDTRVISPHTHASHFHAPADFHARSFIFTLCYPWAERETALIVCTTMLYSAILMLCDDAPVWPKALGTVSRRCVPFSGYKRRVLVTTSVVKPRLNCHLNSVIKALVRDRNHFYEANW